MMLTARRGSSLLWSSFCLTALMGLGSFAVDFGRVTLAKTELRRAADAAARAGAWGLAISNAQAKSDATAWSKKNRVDGRTLTDGGITVTLGKWDDAKRTFRTKLKGDEIADAVRVVLKRPATGPEALPLIWANLIGVQGIEVNAEAIAKFIPGQHRNHQVDGVANPFLAGMPAGTVASLNNPHNSPDYAGDAASSDPKKRRQSPPVVPLTVKPGQVLQFDSIAGTVRHDPKLPYFRPDGELTDVGHNTRGNEHGIADTRAPINALVGLFLTDERPDRSAAPTSDHHGATDAGRAFDQLEPKLKQIFFIGDGKRSDGQQQRFIVPEGATRLYLATWDFYEWNNNDGYRTVKVERPGAVITVK